MLQWLGYGISYILFPDETASAFLTTFKLDWWVHELCMFFHHAWIVGAEGLLVYWVRQKPRWAIAIWRGLQWSWYYLRRGWQWLRRKLHIPAIARFNRLRVPEHANGNGKRFTLRDMFLTATTPYIAKLANIAMVIQWREYRWKGFLAVWLGGCIRLLAYPFLGKWVFVIAGAYLFIRIWQLAKWPLPRVFKAKPKNQEEEIVP